jgi:4'-phosphopantetheinyl transferase
MTTSDQNPSLHEPDQIDLWLARPEAANDSYLLSQYKELMTEEERARASQFHLSRDCDRYIVTRALVRTTLSRYASVHPSEWIFTPNIYGRPQVAVKDTLARRIAFNVSHTMGLVVLAVRWERSVGVDVENAHGRNGAWEDLGYQFFAPLEREALKAVPADSRSKRFFEYWTLKESYVKARGYGLSLPLDSFSMIFSGQGSIKLLIDPLNNDDVSHWYLWQCWPTQEHVIALCAECSSTTPTVSVYEVVPLKHDFPLRVSPIRTSIHF